MAKSSSSVPTTVPSSVTTRNRPVSGDRSRVRGRDDAGSRSRADSPLHHVVVEVDPRSAGAIGEAFAQKMQRLVERFSFEVSERPCSTANVEQLVGAPLATRDLGHDLLGEDIDGVFRNRDVVEPPGTNGSDQGHALDEFVAGQREQSTFRRLAERVTGPANPLQKRRDGSGRADLNHKINEADVESQFQRCSCDDRFELPGLEPVLGVEPPVRGD